MRKPLILLVVPLLLAGVSSCERKAEQQQQQAETPDTPQKGVDRSHAGSALPDAALFDPDEQKVALAKAGGEPLLVNLWASWCAPCVKELPTLNALSRRPGAPKVVIVSEDIGERASVDAFLDSHGIKDLETWRDPDLALSSALPVQVMPTTVYYDASGHEVWRYTGDLDWTGEEAARLLAEGAKAASAR